MTPDELIRMAQKAGLTDPDLGECVTDYGDATEGVLRFAKLVAAAEREACAQVCAQVCDEVESRADDLWNRHAYPEDQGMSMGASQCAAAIRARVEK